MSFNPRLEKPVLSLRTGVLTLSRSCVGAVHGAVPSISRCAALRTVRARPALAILAAGSPGHTAHHTQQHADAGRYRSSPRSVLGLIWQEHKYCCCGPCAPRPLALSTVLTSYCICAPQVRRSAFIVERASLIFAAFAAYATTWSCDGGRLHGDRTVDVRHCRQLGQPPPHGGRPVCTPDSVRWRLLARYDACSCVSRAAAAAAIWKCLRGGQSRLVCAPACRSASGVIAPGAGCVDSVLCWSRPRDMLVCMWCSPCGARVRTS